MHKILVAFILLFLAGCGYQRPVLYPNPHREDGRDFWQGLFKTLRGYKISEV